ncbi:tRNA-intron lyase [Halomarina halobia]|uniref:tRNA-splicing endonuclease n=1 Tax=Halomarina halobia TaxID=3033386 RepID=A0ABD6AAU0_9EURY|nr:tRNA-intron lyase [Halomarina sp. PSR21]
MHATLDGDAVRVDPPGRERFYDSRGYGRPDGNALDLAPVEAAHLLFRGDLESVDGMGFRAFLAATDCTLPFLVYKDLRDRGFYLSPAREGWADGADAPGTGAAGEASETDFVVFPRGKGPWDGAVEYRVRVLGERETLRAAALADADTLAVVDEESELTYLAVERPELTGESADDLPTGVSAALLADRAVLWDPPRDLYARTFYGQPLDGRDADGALQCSLVEAAYLAERGAIRVDAGREGVVERGRAVEGERFDRRLAVYRALRGAGVVPKTGFKFGADFRTYATVRSVEELGHSEHLVRVVARDHAFTPRDLALDVRLAHGVRKRMVFALADADGEVDWLSVGRLTP